MAFSPEKPETEEATGGRFGRFGSYGLLAGTAVASWYVIPVLAAVISAAPVVAAVAAIGGAAVIAAKKEWREPAVSFFKKLGSAFGGALSQLASDYRGLKGWAKEKAEATQSLAAPANDDTAPSTLGAKASAADFNASADPAAKPAATAKPAPKPAQVQRLG
ncbi:MAG TPA: hypothetical protein VEF76_14515 [Patescibacteria group bacterium]|nr:hypothetical protein [Patescibacteria group bacterium]